MVEKRNFIAKKITYERLTNNEKKVISYLVKNSRMTDSEIASEMRLNTSSISRIRARLLDKGIIKGYTLSIDFERLGIECFVIAFYSATNKWWERVDDDAVHDIMASPFIINCMRTNEKNLSYMITYGFKNNKQANQYFDDVQRVYNDYLVVEKLIFLSNRNILKNSAASLLKVLSLNDDNVKPNQNLFQEIVGKKR
jgi:Lrp/AsnC family transcriptional regulator, leucine-responsive regulatory protein